MGRLVQDLRTAIRGLRRSPTFVIATVLILGLGTGMAIAMWATVDAVLVRRFPVQNQDRLAVLWAYQVPTVEYSVPAADLPEIQHASRTMRSLAGVVHWGNDALPLLDGDRTIVLRSLFVTANYFDVLGARPVLGRFSRPEDAAPGAPQVIILSYGAWQSQFAGSPSVVGRTLVYAGWRLPVTVIGVAPPGLDYPAGVECWSPMQRDAKSQVFAVARLADGATIDAARQEFFAAASHLEPIFKLTGAKAETFTTAVIGNVRPTLLALAAAVVVLLGIAYINVGTLMLARATSRAGELALRRALGASRTDIARHLLVECVIVAAVGGVAGAACAEALVSAVVSLAPTDIARISDVRLHADLLTVGVGVTMLVVLILGLLPAIAGASRAIPGSVQLSARSGKQTRRQRDARQWLVASQVGLALVMLAGASLLVRSLLDLEHLSLGYRPDHLAMGRVMVNGEVYDSLDKIAALSDQVMQRVRAIPGVSAATPTLLPPFTPPSVNQAAARALFPGQNPIGEMLNVFGGDREIVGVAGDVKSFLDQPTQPGGYIPVGQTPFQALQLFASWFPTSVVVRTSVDPLALGHSVEQELETIDPSVGIGHVRTMVQVRSAAVAMREFNMTLLSIFAALALVLAAIGIYGVIAYSVTQRTHEIGVRIALGAGRGDVMGLVLRQGIVLAGLGIGLGVAGALALTRLLASYLYGVQPTDPIALSSTALFLAAVAMLASYVPARRATKVDPLIALRRD